MSKVKLPYTLTPNENKETVLITYDTGRKNWNGYRFKGRRTWQYALIAAKAKELGWPTLFAADMTNHDAYNLVTVDPQVFLWTVRNTGTWLFTSNQNIEWRQAIAKQNEDAKYYIVTSTGLQEITAEQFAEYKFREQ